MESVITQMWNVQKRLIHRNRKQIHRWLESWRCWRKWEVMAKGCRIFLGGGGDENVVKVTVIQLKNSEYTKKHGYIEWNKTEFNIAVRLKKADCHITIPWNFGWDISENDDSGNNRMTLCCFHTQGFLVVYQIKIPRGTHFKTVSSADDSCFGIFTSSQSVIQNGIEKINLTEHWQLYHHDSQTTA